MDFDHLLHDLFRCQRIAKTPTRHGISLGKPIDQDRPLFHPRKGYDGHVFFFVSKLRIDLIGNHENVFFPDHLRNGFQILLFHDRTGRVVGEGKNQDLGLLCDGIS